MLFRSGSGTEDSNQMYSEIAAHSTGVVSIQESPLGTNLISVGKIFKCYFILLDGDKMKRFYFIYLLTLDLLPMFVSSAD